MEKKKEKTLLTVAIKLIIYTLIVVFVTFFLTCKFLLPDNSTTNSKTPNESGSQKYDYTEKSGFSNNSGSNSIQSREVILHGPRDKRKIALTFDAEMTDLMKANLQSGKVKSSYDRRIVEILNKTNTKATFFLTGMWIELYPEVTKELSQDPLFELGSHSYTDTSYEGHCFGLRQIPDSLNTEEIGATEKLLRENAGIDNQLFRFPGGCYGPKDIMSVIEAGDIIVHWDISAHDGFNQNPKTIEQTVINNTQNGSIIVMHLNGAPTAPKTADALPEIISALKKKGFEFVKVNELLGLPAEQKSANF